MQDPDTPPASPDSVATTPTTEAAPPEPRESFLRMLDRLRKEHPVYSTLFALATFILAWSGTKLLDTGYSWLFPDAAALRAENLRVKIDERTSRIESAMAALNGADTEEEVRRLTATILDEMAALRPDITRFADDVGSVTDRFVTTKNRDLARVGMSSQEDFVLMKDDGITLCAARFNLGLLDFNTVNRDVGIRLSGPTGESGNGWLDPGESLRLDDNGSAVVVSYLGMISEEGPWRFNFNCLEG